ncbi:hypothetical protein niasHT_030590 [Heterodera trifolii]|uniref:Uncharacterized protein n=1 Tax=Heterodera trifolii TaxID=157864 RepID=A0ABD2ITL6_9BILA
MPDSDSDSQPNTDFQSHFEYAADEHMVATELMWRHHKMFDGWVGYIATHDANRLRWWCRNCNSRFYETYEFSRSGKKKRYGRYRLHTSTKERRPCNMAYHDVSRVFSNMPDTTYNLGTFNCKHWAQHFFPLF